MTNGVSSALLTLPCQTTLHDALSDQFGGLRRSDGLVGECPVWAGSVRELIAS
jgi:hypothetical protein